jgi:hypothetical protein
MALPSSHEFVEFFFIDWLFDLLQKIYTNLTLFSNAFKVNQKIETFILKNTQNNKKCDIEQNLEVLVLSNMIY